jgi:hypothetical protein
MKGVGFRKTVGNPLFFLVVNIYDELWCGGVRWGAKNENYRAVLRLAY